MHANLADLRRMATPYHPGPFVQFWQSKAEAVSGYGKNRGQRPYRAPSCLHTSTGHGGQNVLNLPTCIRQQLGRTLAGNLRNLVPHAGRILAGTCITIKCLAGFSGIS
jgi:hypothetical protein